MGPVVWLDGGFLCSRAVAFLDAGSGSKTDGHGARSAAIVALRRQLRQVGANVAARSPGGRAARCARETGEVGLSVTRPG